MSFLSVAAALALAGCDKPQQPAPAPAPAPAGQTAAPAKATNSSSGGSVITAPVDYLGSIAQSKKATDKKIEVTALNQAVQLFYAQEDRFPKTLDELVEKKYLGAIPTPPFGSKIVYDAKTGEVKIVAQ